MALIGAAMILQRTAAFCQVSSAALVGGKVLVEAISPELQLQRRTLLWMRMMLHSCSVDMLEPFEVHVSRSMKWWV